jgi:mannose/fructose-specific phosphotransferase system component IIA
MKRYILSAVVILLSIAVAETEQVRQVGEMPEMSEEYLAQRDAILNPVFETRNTVVVDQFGGGDYNTIQEAIDATQGSDVIIQVNAGVYYETPYISNTSNRELRGAGMGRRY